MKLFRAFLVLMFCVSLYSVSYAQDDDDKERKRKRAKIYVPKVKQSSKVKHSKKRDDLFRGETFKSTKQSEKAQARANKKRYKKQEKKYKKTRGDLQNKTTAKRMKKNERMSRKINQQRTMPLTKRVGARFKPTNKSRMAASRRRSDELHKREDKARTRYESTYTPTSKRKKKDKLREFYNPFKRNK